jgi:hypothetical protein
MDETKVEPKSEDNPKQEWFDKVCEGLHRYIYGNEEAFWNEIEIEAKLGKILFQGKYLEEFSKREDAFLINGLFKNNKDNFVGFDASVTEEQFFVLFDDLHKEFSNYNPSRMKGPVKSIDYDGRGYRISKIDSNVTEVIKKMNKTNFDIRNSGNDLRFSIAREKRFPDNKKITLSGYEREKYRISFKYELLVVEFTIVKTFCHKQFKNVKFEVEIEFDKIRENAKIYKHNYKVFEAIIQDMNKKVQKMYNSLEKLTIEEVKIVELKKIFNFEM